MVAEVVPGVLAAVPGGHFVVEAISKHVEGLFFAIVAEPFPCPLKV